MSVETLLALGYGLAHPGTGSKNIRIPFHVPIGGAILTRADSGRPCSYGGWMASISERCVDSDVSVSDGAFAGAGS